MAVALMVLLGLFVDFLEWNDKETERMRQEEERRKAEVEANARAPKPCVLCDHRPDKA